MVGAGVAVPLVGLEAVVVAVVGNNSLGWVGDCGPCSQEGHSGRWRKAGGVGRLGGLGRMEDGDLVEESGVCLAIG